jgi:tagaturonate reductase
MIKVRILNGAHTAMVPVSLLFGNKLVMETVNGDFTRPFVDNVIAEISETLPMDKNEITAYAEEVIDRFRNPFIKHALADIALNSISKFKVRVLPSLLGYHKTNKKLPISLTFSLACLIQFYKGTWNNEALPVKDIPELVEAFKKAWELENVDSVVAAVLANTDFWDEDLNKVDGLAQALVHALNEIEANGIQQGYLNFSK